MSDGVMDPRWGDLPYSPIEGVNAGAVDPNRMGMLVNQPASMQRPPPTEFRGVERTGEGGVVRNPPMKPGIMEKLMYLAPALASLPILPAVAPAYLALGLGAMGRNDRQADNALRGFEKEASEYELNRFNLGTRGGSDEVQRAYAQYLYEGGDASFVEFADWWFTQKRSPIVGVDESGNRRVYEPSAGMQAGGTADNAVLPGGTMESDTGFQRQTDFAGDVAEEETSRRMQPEAKAQLNQLVANNRRGLDRYNRLLTVLQDMGTGPLLGNTKARFLTDYQAARAMIRQNALLYIGALSDKGIRLNPITENELKLMFEGQPQLENNAEANVKIIQQEKELIERALNELADKQEWVSLGNRIEDFPEYNPVSPSEEALDWQNRNPAPAPEIPTDDTERKNKLRSILGLD